MIPNTIRIEKETTYYNTAYMLMERAEKWFKKNGIEYELLTGDEIPEDKPQGHYMPGRKSKYRFPGTVCIKSHMNVEDLERTLVDIMHTSSDDEL